MALDWTRKENEVDFVDAEDVNDLAAAIIENENNIKLNALKIKENIDRLDILESSENVIGSISQTAASYARMFTDNLRGNTDVTVADVLSLAFSNSEQISNIIADVQRFGYELVNKADKPYKINLDLHQSSELIFNFNEEPYNSYNNFEVDVTWSSDYNTPLELLLPNSEHYEVFIKFHNNKSSNAILTFVSVYSPLKYLGEAPEGIGANETWEYHIKDDVIAAAKVVSA